MVNKCSSHVPKLEPNFRKGGAAQMGSAAPENPQKRTLIPAELPEQPLTPSLAAAAKPFGVTSGTDDVVPNEQRDSHKPKSKNDFVNRAVIFFTLASRRGASFPGPRLGEHML